jgi:UDP-N-acetylmuramoylalanine--D-glutamate ligase
MAKILAGFPGVEHRLEKVCTIDGITFVNDSKSTTVDSLRVALLSYDQPLHLIVGGKDKGGDFNVVRDLIKQKVLSLHIIGEARDKIFDTWQTLLENDRISTPDTLQEAVHAAFDMARSGDIILFSPACASFDMFSNYEERGEKFKLIIKEINVHNEEKT